MAGVELRYLYVGCAETGAALAAWLGLPGARLRWRFERFGAVVAAVDTGRPPVVLLADHRRAGSVLPIYGVDDLASATDALNGRGWASVVGPLETPEGPAVVLAGPGGAELALLRVDRPDVLDRAYAERADRQAVPQ